MNRAAAVSCLSSVSMMSPSSRSSHNDTANIFVFTAQTHDPVKSPSSSSPLTSPSSSASGLSVGSLNIRSIRHRSATVTDLLDSFRLDILAVQETWHESSESLDLLRSVPTGYGVVEAGRPREANIKSRGRVSVGRGVAIIHRSGFKVKKMTALPKTTTFEYVGCHISTGDKGGLVVISIYRPGSKPLKLDFYTEFTVLLESLVTYRCPIILLGDLNIHFERVDDAKVIDFIDLLSSFDMQQWVRELTHSAGGWLDVVITRANYLVMDITVTKTGVSDHCLVTCRLPTVVQSSQVVPTMGRKWRGFVLEEFMNDLSCKILCAAPDWMQSVSVDDLFEIYSDEITALLDNHAPIYVPKRKRCLLSPWFDNECRQYRRNGRHWERKYRKTHNPDDRLSWEEALKTQSRVYREKEQAYWLSRISNSAGNTRRLWRDMNDLMKRDNDVAPLSAAEAAYYSRVCR
jgi:exonuclease III